MAKANPITKRSATQALYGGLVIDAIHRPLLASQKLWHGTAHSPRRNYEWFAYPDGTYLSVRAERPNTPGGFFYLEKTPPHFRRSIISAVRCASQRVQS